MFPIEKNIDLKPYNTYQISCIADFFVQVNTLNELKEALNFSQNKNIPYLVIGGASNILFATNRFKWLIIKIKIKKFTKQQSGQLTLGSGQNLSTLTKIYPQLWWIPGTIWGAIRGNIGAFWLEIKDILVNWLVYNVTNDTLTNFLNQDFHFHYRHSYLKENLGLILIEATFNTNYSYSSLDLSAIKEKRNAQPKKPSCGSFFRNPSTGSAWMYIDQCHLKGKKIGKAQVSLQHANFIINTGDASGQDIFKLSILCQEKVKKKFNINLEPEVLIIR